MTNGAAGLAGAAIGVGFLGISLGVTGQIVKQTRRGIRMKQTRNKRLKRSGII